MNALLTEEHSSKTLDLRVPEALLEHLYGAGRVSGLEKIPAPWGALLRRDQRCSGLVAAGLRTSKDLLWPEVANRRASASASKGSIRAT